MSQPRPPASTKPLPKRAHPWPQALLKAFSLGLFMHGLAAPFLAFGTAGILAFWKSGSLAPLVLGLPFVAFGVLTETATVWRGLYLGQYCRLREIWGGGKWVESAARAKLATPCQRRLMLSAATDAGFADEAQDLLRRHQVSTWKVWTWMRASKRLGARRKEVPFSLPGGRG